MPGDGRSKPSGRRIPPGAGTSGFPAVVVALGMDQGRLSASCAHLTYGGGMTTIQSLDCFTGIGPQEFWKWIDTHVHCRRDILVTGRHLAMHMDMLDLTGRVQGAYGARWESKSPITKPFIIRLERTKRHQRGTPCSEQAESKSCKLSMLLSDAENFFGRDFELKQNIVSSADMLEATIAYLKMIYGIDGGRFAPTVYAQGMSLLSNRFLDVKTSKGTYKVTREPDECNPGEFIEHWKQTKKVTRDKQFGIYPVTFPKLKERERRAYIGSVREYYLSEEQLGTPIPGITALDVNGMYLSILETESMPIKCVDWNMDQELLAAQAGYEGDDEEQELEAAKARLREFLMMDKGLIADVSIVVDSPRPWVPVKVGERNVFSNGHMVATLTGVDLERALREEDAFITQIHGVNVYEMSRVFQPFARFVGSLRDDLKESSDPYAKLLEGSVKALGHIHGKFAARQEQWVDADNDLASMVRDCCPASGEPTEFITDEGFMLGRIVLGVPQVMVGTKDAARTSVAISAYVMAYGRKMIREIQELAGEGHYFYSDTDSCFVDKEGLERIRLMDRIGRKRGQLKIDAEGELVVYKLGRYDIGDRVRRMGQSRSSLAQESPHTIPSDPRTGSACRTPDDHARAGSPPSTPTPSGIGTG